MQLLTPLLFVLLGLALFVISLTLRARTGNKYEIKSIDLIIALLPIVLWLFGTGKIGKLNLFGLGFEASKAIKDASNEPIEQQVTSISIEDAVRSVETAVKGPVRRIPELLEKKTEALEFRLGYGGYAGGAIEEYFKNLSTQPFFKYVIINDPEGKLFGILDAKQITRYVREDGPLSHNRLARILNTPNEESLQELRELPGFLPAEDAVQLEGSKSEVLEKMETLNLETLPVVDGAGRFRGVVDRSRLTASLILDIQKRLED